MMFIWLIRQKNQTGGAKSWGALYRCLALSLNEFCSGREVIRAGGDFVPRPVSGTRCEKDQHGKKCCTIEREAQAPDLSNYEKKLS
jgi:hypothetical protein